MGNVSENRNVWISDTIFYFSVWNPSFLSRLDFLKFRFQIAKSDWIQMFLSRFQTLSAIWTIWKLNETDLSEIQTSSDFRHLLYLLLWLCLHSRQQMPSQRVRKGWFCWAELRLYLDPANSILKFVSSIRPYSRTLATSGWDIATDAKCLSGRVEKVSTSAARQTCTSSNLSWKKSTT